MNCGLRLREGQGGARGEQGRGARARVAHSRDRAPQSVGIDPPPSLPKGTCARASFECAYARININISRARAPTSTIDMYIASTGTRAPRACEGRRGDSGGAAGGGAPAAVQRHEHHALLREVGVGALQEAEENGLEEDAQLVLQVVHEVLHQEPEDLQRQPGARRPRQADETRAWRSGRRRKERSRLRRL